jgi:hypothetical protein
MSFLKRLFGIKGSSQPQRDLILDSKCTKQSKAGNEMVFDVSLKVVRNRRYPVSGRIISSEEQTITKAVNTLAYLHPGLVSPQNVNVTIGDDAISVEVSVKTTASNAARMKKDFIEAMDDCDPTFGDGPWR